MTSQDWLKRFLEAEGAVAGSVHQLVRRDGAEVLELAASINLPPPVVEKTRLIPKGKGMAGLAWERDTTVSTCNLQTDSTGDVRPGAKAVGAQAAVAIPVHDESGQLRAVVGVAFLGEREFSDGDLRAFEQRARALPRA